MCCPPPLKPVDPIFTDISSKMIIGQADNWENSYSPHGRYSDIWALISRPADKKKRIFGKKDGTFFRINMFLHHLIEPLKFHAGIS